MTYAVVAAVVEVLLSLVNWEETNIFWVPVIETDYQFPVAKFKNIHLDSPSLWSHTTLSHSIPIILNRWTISRRRHRQIR